MIGKKAYRFRGRSTRVQGTSVFRELSYENELPRTSRSTVKFVVFNLVTVIFVRRLRDKTSRNFERAPTTEFRDARNRYSARRNRQLDDDAILIFRNRSRRYHGASHYRAIFTRSRRNYIAVRIQLFRRFVVNRTFTSEVIRYEFCADDTVSGIIVVHVDGPHIIQSVFSPCPREKKSFL